MPYDYADFEFMMCAIRILVIVGVVAVISYVAKSRAMLVAGTLGSLLGCVAPHGGIHINGTAEAVYMGQLHFTASNILWWGVVGASIGCLTVRQFNGSSLPSNTPCGQFSPPLLSSRSCWD